MSLNQRFVYIWKYTVHPQFTDQFLQAYGPDGTWVQFFKTDTNYLGTVLLRDDSNERAYITIDYWKSKSARDEFRVQNQEEFNIIDQHCENFTVDEQLIGDFSIIGDARQNIQRLS